MMGGGTGRLSFGVVVINVDVLTDRKTHFQVDGDHKGRTRADHAKILPGHLRLIHE